MNSTIIYLASGLTLLLMTFILLYVIHQKNKEAFAVLNPHTEMHNIPIEQQYIYQGHTVPLAYEDRPAGPRESETPDRTMFPLHKYKVAPECCPAVYSTDQGCVCWDPVDSSNKVNMVDSMPTI